MLREGVTVYVLFVTLAKLNCISCGRLPMRLLPGTRLPVLFMRIASTRSVSPSCIRSRIIVPVRKTVKAVNKMRRVRSLVSDHRSSVGVSFGSGVGFGVATLGLRRGVGRVTSSLPRNFAVRMRGVSISVLTNNFVSLRIHKSNNASQIHGLIRGRVEPSLRGVSNVTSIGVCNNHRGTVRIRLSPSTYGTLGLAPSTVDDLLARGARRGTFINCTDRPSKGCFIRIGSPCARISSLRGVIITSNPILLGSITAIFFSVGRRADCDQIGNGSTISISLLTSSRTGLVRLSRHAIKIVSHLGRRLTPLSLSVIMRGGRTRAVRSGVSRVVHLTVINNLLTIIVL